jgi:hypothetical protein
MQALLIVVALALRPISLGASTRGLARVDVRHTHAMVSISPGARATASRRRSPVVMGIKWIDKVSSMIATHNAGVAISTALVGACGLLWLLLRSFVRFVLQGTNTLAQTAAAAGLATKTDLNALATSVNLRIDGVNSRIDGLETSVNLRIDGVNSRLDTILALFSTIAPALAEHGRRALVSDCALATLRVLSRKAIANSTVVHLRLDGVDDGLTLAGERYRLMELCSGRTLGAATILVVDSSTLKPVHEWGVLKMCAGELGTADAGTVVSAAQRVSAAGAAPEWEMTLIGET